jgi:hypothetical protein
VKFAGNGYNFMTFGLCEADNILVRVRVMVFNPTFNNISAILWQSVLVV